MRVAALLGLVCKMVTVNGVGETDRKQMHRNKYIVTSVNFPLREQILNFYSFATIFYAPALCCYSGVNKTQSLLLWTLHFNGGGEGHRQSIIRYTVLYICDKIVTSAVRKNKVGWSDGETSLDKGGQEKSL